MRSMKTIFFHARNLFLVFFLFCISATAQFREEMGTLETMYEARARAAINTVLRPYEYSLVVAVDIDRDETRLAKLQEEFEKDTLPGMGGASSSDNPAIANQLYELKNKIEIHLVLSNKITKEKEATVVSLLKMKLHLDEKNGDTLTIARSDLPAANEDQSASKLPELSWKMWGMLTVLLLLALSGIFYFFDRRAKAKKEKENDKDQKEKDLNEKIPEQNMMAHNENNEKESDIPKIDPSELMYEQKQQILSLASQYPESSIESLTEHFQKGHERDILLMCEAFGWELAKKVFSGFSPKIWGRLGYMVVSQTEQASMIEISGALENCGRVILKRFLEIGSDDPKNPFGFIFKINNDDRERVLNNESAANIALICAHGKPEDVADLMASLSPETQEAVTMAVTRLKTFSEQQARALSETLLKKLKAIKENPETKANGIEIAAGLIRSLPAEKEYSFFEKLKQENPSDAEKIRRTILMFSDIVFVPADVITDMGALLDISVIVSALRIGFPEVREHILASLPPKKAYMIQRDLELDFLGNVKQVAMSQREMIKTITSLLKAKNIELDNLFQKMDGSTDSDSGDLLTKVS